MVKGKIDIIENFEMKELNRKRTLRIYTPPKYDNSIDNYPVIYMHDAQNLFDPKTSSFGDIWDVHTTMDKIYHETGKGFIVVGIDHGCEFRYNEYSPFEDDRIVEVMPHAKSTGHFGGEGDLYGEFLVNTLKPYIDSNYRTLSGREHTAISGSSMGGLISLYVGLNYQEVFSKIGAFSSALFFAEDKMKNWAENVKIKEDMKVYMDIGTNETSNHDLKEFPKMYLNTNKEMVEILNKKDLHVKFIIDEGAEHNENAWSKRYPEAIKYLFDI